MTRWLRYATTGAKVLVAACGCAVLALGARGDTGAAPTDPSWTTVSFAAQEDGRRVDLRIRRTPEVISAIRRLERATPRAVSAGHPTGEAAPTSPASRRLRYTGTELVQGLFAFGPAAGAFDFGLREGIVADAATRKYVSETVLPSIERLDPTIIDGVAAGMQSGQPARVEASLDSLGTLLARVYAQATGNSLSDELARAENTIQRDTTVFGFFFIIVVAVAFLLVAVQVGVEISTAAAIETVAYANTYLHGAVPGSATKSAGLSKAEREAFIGHITRSLAK